MSGHNTSDWIGRLSVSIVYVLHKNLTCVFRIAAVYNTVLQYKQLFMILLWLLFGT